LRGWANNLSRFYKKEIERLTLLFDELDLKVEVTPLNVVERASKKEPDECLANLRRAEETQRAQ
jgi:hypothetical protein